MNDDNTNDDKQAEQRLDPGPAGAEAEDQDREAASAQEPAGADPKDGDRPGGDASDLGAAGPDDEARRAEEQAREADRVRALFTRSEASVAEIGGDRFRFARWTRPIVPAFIGLAEESASVMREGFRDAAALAGLEMADEDPDLGANILVLVCENWPDLAKTPHLERLVPDLGSLLTMLAAADANQYRIFTFGPDGGLRLCVAMLRYDAALAQLSAPSLALGQAVQTLLLWSDDAFLGESPVTVRRGGKPLVKSRFARLLKAAYAPETPAYSEDPALADALAERISTLRAEGGERGRRSDSAGSDGGSRSGGAADPLGGDPRPEEEEPASDGAVDAVD